MGVYEAAAATIWLTMLSPHGSNTALEGEGGSYVPFPRRLVPNEHVERAVLAHHLNGRGLLARREHEVQARAADAKADHLGALDPER